MEKSDMKMYLYVLCLCDGCEDLISFYSKREVIF